MTRDLDHTSSLSLICYDGSESSIEAVQQFAQMFPNTKAVIFNAWHAYRHAQTSYPGWSDYIECIESARERESLKLVEEGTRLARYSGLNARGEAYCYDGPSGRAIVERAAIGDCLMVVVGSLGHSALGGALLGSVSRFVLHHCSIPVLVVRLDKSAQSDSEPAREAALDLAQ